MQESLAPEHGGELLGDALEELLDGGAVADEGGGHLEGRKGDINNYYRLNDIVVCLLGMLQSEP